MAVTQHLFPLRLDGAAQDVSAAAQWNGKTSLIEVSAAAAAFDIDLVAAEEPGTMLTINVTGASLANDVTVKDPADNAITTLDSPTDNICLMWTGSAWVVIANSTSTGTLSETNLALTGTLSVAGAATLNGNVAVGNAITDTVGFYGATAVAQQAAAAQTAVTAETDLPAAGAGASASYTQAEVTAAIENIHDLIALTNEIRQCLVDLGLIKGAAA